MGPLLAAPSSLLTRQATRIATGSGRWAEYRVYEGGVMQVVHRMSSPEALAWSEKCRTLYAADGVDYAAYALGALGDRCFNIALR